MFLVTMFSCNFIVLTSNIKDGVLIMYGNRCCRKSKHWSFSKQGQIQLPIFSLNLTSVGLRKRYANISVFFKIHSQFCMNKVNT